MSSTHSILPILRRSDEIIHPPSRVRKGVHMKANNGILARLALAAVCLTAIAAAPAARAEMNTTGNTNGVEVITNGPQTNPGDARGMRSAPANVRDSNRYEALVHSNPSFRAARERKECGPIDDARMHAECVAGF